MQMKSSVFGIGLVTALSLAAAVATTRVRLEDDNPSAEGERAFSPSREAGVKMAISGYVSAR
jgi:hypothetical protein